MNDRDIAELRGHVFGLQTVLAVCLAKVCELMQQPNEFLDEIQKLVIPRMKDAAPAFVVPPHTKNFENAAIASVGQIAEAARDLISNPTQKFDA